MKRARRTNFQVDGSREAIRLAATLAADVKRTRVRRRLTQRGLADRVGLSQGRISDIERGDGAAVPLDTWVALGLALNRPLAISFSRDLEPEEPRDAGHLRAQEVVLQLAQRSGRRADFELPTHPADPARSIDVVIRDDVSRCLVVIEIWNRLDDLGAAVRSTSRKVAEADGLAVLAAGDGPPYRVASCWLLVDTARNRRLLAAYPGIFAARFRGSSLGWVQCLANGAAPPLAPGLAWIDTRAGRVLPVRRRRIAETPTTAR